MTFHAAISILILLAIEGSSKHEYDPELGRSDLKMGDEVGPLSMKVIIMLH